MFRDRNARTCDGQISLDIDFKDEVKDEDVVS